MSRLNITIKTLEIPLPTGPIIRANELQDYQKNTDIIEQARREADKIQQEANALLERAWQECDEVRESARQEGQKQADEERPVWRRQAVTDVVQWLVTEHELERNIIERLEPRLRESMAEAFATFYGQQDKAHILMERLRAPITKLLAEEAGTLHVNPDQWESLHQAFAAWPHLRVKSDANFRAGQAMLTSPFVVLHIDLEEQLDAILSSFLNCGEGIRHDCED